MIAFRVVHYPVLDSTNNLALSLSLEGAEEGTVVVADYQTKGRGRFDRRWVSRRGRDLLFSILLRPKLSVQEAPILTHVAAKCVARVLEQEFQLPAKLKKPNDVLINGKKVCGILTESRARASRLDHVIVGIGLNINSGKQDLPDGATSISLETRQKIDRSELLERMLHHFAHEYDKTTR